MCSAFVYVEMCRKALYLCNACSAIGLIKLTELMSLTNAIVFGGVLIIPLNFSFMLLSGEDLSYVVQRFG